MNHLLTLAESHIEDVILAKFIEAVKRLVFLEMLLIFMTVILGIAHYQIAKGGK